MQKVNRLQDKWRNVAFLLTALLIVVVDQLSKEWIRSNLDKGESLPEAGFFQLTHVNNTGAVFGLFQGQSFALTIVASVGIAVILAYGLFLYRRFPYLDNMLGKSALGLVLGGTVGNLIDRLRFVFDNTAGNLVERLNLGYVTDFIDFGFWPAFNIADSAVTVGVFIIACYFLYLARAGKQ